MIEDRVNREIPYMELKLFQAMKNKAEASDVEKLAENKVDKIVVDQIVDRINKIEEDGEGAPTNAVAHGGVDMNPTGKKTVLGKMKKRIKESDDNNNVTLRSVLKTIDKLDEAIDEKSGIVREEITLVEPEVKQTFIEKFKV